MNKVKFKISGMKCQNCAAIIEDKLKNINGVVKAKVNQESCLGVAVYDEQKIGKSNIFGAIKSIGMFDSEEVLYQEEKPPADSNNNSTAEFFSVACPFCKKKYSVKMQGKAIYEYEKK